MRFQIVSSIVAACAVAACAHEELGVTTSAPAPAPATARVSRTPQPTSSPYVVADIDERVMAMRAAVAVALEGSGNVGVVVGSTRVILEHGQQRFAPEAAPDSLRGTRRIPSRLGGGFLFWTESILYRSQTFDGALMPIARLPNSNIETVSFAPKAIFVRTYESERWAMSPTGERVAMDLPALASIEALDDGRVLAFDSFGAAFSSVDAGQHWTNVTSQLRASPRRIAVVGNELWLFDSKDGVLVFEPGGRLQFSPDKKQPKPLEVRPIDPRWHGDVPPLRAALQWGAALDDRMALVAQKGDLARIDMRTGEIASMVAGKIPSDAHCEAIASGGDILFACRKDGGGALVVSRTVHGDNPVIERTFTEDGVFYASDDGGLAFDKGCDPKTSARSPACVRQPDGSWKQYDLSGLGGNASGRSTTVLRWIPSADGHAITLVSGSSLAIYNPRSGVRVPLRESDVVDNIRRSESQRSPDSLVDRLWSLSPSGTLRGWARWSGHVFEVTADGRAGSPYEFMRLTTSGPYALGQRRDERFLQSTDHGATWTLVAGPPAGSEGMIDCSSAGCDLGGFYRIGWPTTPPETPMPIAPQALDIGRQVPVELSCRPAGDIVSKALAYTKDSPEDLGLGAVRLPKTPTCSRRVYFNAMHPFFYRSLLTQHRWSFIAPFDPLGVIKTTTIAINEALAAAHTAGGMGDEANEYAYSQFPMTPFDPSQASDLGLVFYPGVLAQVRAAGRPGEAVRSTTTRMVVRQQSNIVSGVVLNERESAFLEFAASSREHVFKVGQAGTTELFDVAARAPENSALALHPDALAMGPDGDLAVLRTPSGNDPPSAMDPAMLWLDGQSPRVLAPWSTLTLANDDACRKDTGYRATLETTRPWVRVASVDLDAWEESTPMLVRVKWNDKRVCLEGLAVRLPNVEVPVSFPHGTNPMSIVTWLVARGNTFARVGISEGIEWRQPLECSLVPR